MTTIYYNINYWDNVAFWSAIAVGFCGIVATIMIALQGDANRYWTRPIGIIGTSLVTGITALVTAFHVPENVDKLIDIYSDMANITNNYEHDIQGKAGNEADEIQKKYNDQFLQLKTDLLRIKGSAGRLNTKPPPPSQQGAK